MNRGKICGDDELKDTVLNILNEENKDLYHELENFNYYKYHYCLNYLRENLFIWYPFKKEGSLLEIGAGYGQLTNLFCEKVNKVVSVENDEKLLQILSKRCTCDNLTVLKDDFSQIEYDEKFDYIILCDIFEYAKQFSDSKNPYSDYLSYVKSFLKDDGVILIAISNRLGLKYFAGFKEEHVNKFFAGIDDFPKVDYVKTFSKTELENILKSVGFENYRFFYPYPDHCFPDVISTDDFINKLPYARAPVYYDVKANLFKEHKLNQIFANDNIAQYFSNSFLVEINNSRDNSRAENIKYVKLNTNRDEKFRTSTGIYLEDGELKVRKSPLSLKSVDHLKNMHEAYDYDFGKIKFLVNEFDGENFTYSFIEDNTFEKFLIDSIMLNNKDEFYGLLEYFFDALFYESYVTKDYATDEFLNIFKLKSDIPFHCHDVTNLDVIFNNLFIIDDEITSIDYEWFFKFPIPLEYVFYRVIRHHTVTNPLFRDFESMEDIFNHFNLDVDNFEIFRQWELNFADYVYSALIKPEVKRIPNKLINKLEDFDSINKERLMMKNSRSWKITKPLRKLISAVKR